MKVTLNWLKQYVDFAWSPEELAEQLTMLGLEVESVSHLKSEFEGVVVAEIVASDKHPNADKLSVCRVMDGKGERQIVCGAKNYKVGDKVPLALPGCALPTPPGSPPFTIKVSKMRGVESQGMLCSAKELGVAEDAEGLLILSPEAKVGQPLAEHFGRPGADVIFDLEITPNRPDWNSVIGIAREISAVTGAPLKLPVNQFLNTSSEPIDGVVTVRIEEPDLCPRYTARLIRGVKVGPSPDWLKQSLEKVGLRSINNVVDVTNYVLLETGQPLHAFDYHLLAAAKTPPPVIVVRRAAEGETFVTLDGQKRALTSGMLMIADETKPIGLAGIMGGQNSEINDKTVDVLIESAYFKPQNIRATSKKLELRTDASYRFERGADVGICDWASRRAAQLISDLAGGTILAHHVDAYPQPAIPKEITLRHRKVDQLLGVTISPSRQVEYLRRLGLEIGDSAALGNSATEVLVRIPSFRGDIKSEIDLVEEIARLFGVQNIPATAPRGAIGANDYDHVNTELGGIRRVLTGLSLYETQGQTLISESVAQLAAGTFHQQAVKLSNPLSADMNALRPSLLPGLLEALRHNANHKNFDARFFEIGRIFHKNGNEVAEETRLGLAVTGHRFPSFWAADQTKCDLFDLKGLLEEFFDHAGIRGVSFARAGESSALFVESAQLTLGKQEIGVIGQLIPAIAKQYDLRDPVFLAELRLDTLIERRNTQKSFKSLPAFPAIRRDIAMILPETATHENVLGAIKQAKTPNLETIDLFDVFRGENIGTGKKSVAYAFTYRNAERTLTDNEVNAAHQKLVAHLGQSLQATIRAT